MSTVQLEFNGQVAMIRFAGAHTRVADEPSGGDVHSDLADALEVVRRNEGSRVVVMTGATDGEFCATRPAEAYGTSGAVKRLLPSENFARRFSGVERTLLGMVHLELPIIAKVNGDAMGFGQSVALAADIIVSWDDALFADIHLSMGDGRSSDGRQVGPSFALVPGDGGACLAPMLMPLPMAKEYLMLGKAYTASELATFGIVNYAVPHDDLEEKTQDIVDALLRRPPDALAWTKKIANWQLEQYLSGTLNSSRAYETLCLYRAAQAGEFKSLAAWS